MNYAVTTMRCSALVIKVASRCNLNCTYCYMYNLGDTTYKGQPKIMPDAVVDALLEKTRQHCLQHGLSSFLFGFHGGEPLLAGFDFYHKFIHKAQSLLQPEITPFFCMQTNGVLLSDDWCKLLGELDIHFSISLDGTPEENNRFRIDHAGKGAYDRIVEGLRIAQTSTFLHSRPGILSVININADPVQTYQHFKSLGVRTVNFLLPDATYDQPAPGPDHTPQPSANPTYYGDWLISIFDTWINEPNTERISIRLFQEIISAILGGEFSSEVLGASNNELLVIETDGSIEAVDVLKICGNGFTKKDCNVLTHQLDEAMANDLSALYYLSHSRLCRQCLSCPVKDICGGGYLPHRYHKDNGFNNPSVYCHDLLKLITHIQNKVLDQIPDQVLAAAHVTRLSYKDALDIINQSMEDAAEPYYITELEKF